MCVHARAVQPFQTADRIEKYEAGCGPNSSFRNHRFKYNDIISNQLQFNIYIVFIMLLATAFIWNILPSYEYLVSYAQKAKFLFPLLFIEK
jgi:hypothetical protein